MNSLLLVLILVGLRHLVGGQGTNPYIVGGTGGTFVIQNTASQISTPSLATTIVIPGDSVFDSPATSSVTSRYTCSTYSMVFAMVDPTDPLTLLLTVTRADTDTADCTIYWDDGLTDEEEIEVLLELEHTYIKHGIYRVSMSCDDNVVCPSSYSDCLTTTDFMDNAYKTFDNPLTFFVSKPILVKSYMEFAPSGGTCGQPMINWRITEVDGEILTPFTNFIQPNTSVLRIEPEVLDPGEYILNLEVSFPSKSANHWTEDALIIKVVLPELVAHISGGELLQVPHGGDIFIDATISTDPVFSLPSLALTPLVATWSFAHFSVTPALSVIHLLLKNFPDTTPPAATTKYQIIAGTDNILKVDTSVFTVNTYAAVMFTLSRGDRSSSALQVIHFRSNVLPLSIECVYNCHVGRERLFYYDKIELDAKLPDDVDRSGLTYQWQIKTWNILFNVLNWPVIVTSQTGFKSSSLGISNFLAQGNVYMITVTVTAPGYVATKASFVRRVNHIPYGGTCVLSSLLVTSARDWLTFTCSSWKGNDDRKVKNLLADVNPILTYTVRQQTIGALVEEEPILQTRSQKSHVILKVGAADMSYISSLYIHVTDMYNNYNEVFLSVTSNPAFNVNDVTPTLAGANVVRSYTHVDYPFDEQQLRDMGKSDMIVALVSAVCSNLHLITLPVWKPPVPRKLNTDGAILDLSPSGNKDVGLLDDVSAAANNETTDPATLAIQEVIQNMTSLIKRVVQNDLINGTRKGDKLLSSLITNAFTNLAAKPQFVNFETKVDHIFLADLVGVDALEPENTTEDQSAQIEATSGEIYYMFQAVVQSAVPDNLNQIRNVGDLKSGRVQIGEMLSVIGQNISLEDTELSPVDRAYLYMRMQRKLQLQTDEKKNAAKEAAKMAVSLAKNIQEKLKLCKTCSNENSNKTKQLVKKDNAKSIENETISTETSNFRLDGLQSAIGTDSSPDEPVSVSAFEFPENVYMYDDDRTSSYVTSNILRIDAKTPNKRITPSNMTFEQSVITPEVETITPEVDDEDASEFMYHQFIYQKATDYVCMIVMPLGEYNFTSYLMYLKYDASPSIINYDLKWLIYETDNWQSCILPGDMKGHSGMTYLAVHLPDSKKSVVYNFTLITVGCLTWEEKASKWHSDRCLLDWQPQDNKISCKCRGVTDMVFANSFFVAPNSIDFSSVFLKFSPLNQAAVIGALGGIFVIYIIVILFLIRLDRRDGLKWGITPLRDNMISDRDYYIIKVYTGMRRGAGTTSRIAFVLTGENSDTGPRELFDGFRKEFGTGSVMSYLMATKKGLGELLHLTIWHDNSGEGDDSSWYPNQVVVYDVATRKTYTFVIERWLSLETTVDAHVTAIPSERPVQFESRFFFQTRDRLSESHMWVSIFYRPQISSFTRVQRASCALVYIFLTMIANAMYFNPNPEYESPPLVQVGPLRFTSQQIFISIVCALMTTPVIMLLIFIFKRTKCRPTTPSKPCSCCCKFACCCKCGCCCSTACCRSKKYQEQKQYEEMLKFRMLSSDVPDFRGGIYLPWWFIYVAWFLVLAGTAVPAFFIILYSMEWGKQKSEEWLTTFFMSLLESMLFVDPIMVICLAFILALLIRKNKPDSNVDIDTVIKIYQDRMGQKDEDDPFSSSIKVLKSLRDEQHSYMTAPRTVNPPLQGLHLKEAAKQHKQHEAMVRTIKDTLANLFFMLIISIICFANRDNRSFQHYTRTVNTIVEPFKLPYFKSIIRPGDVFTWLKSSAIPSLFPEYNIIGEPLHWTEKQFTTGLRDLRLGPPRLRQVRTKNGTCDLPYIGKVVCYGKYSITGEDEDNYCLGWQSQPCPKADFVYNVSTDAWNFQSAFDIWGLPIPGLYTTYGGGGFIATLDVGRSNSLAIVDELFRNLWIDRQTRAVMFEFTLYNGATNIFIYHVFLIEFPETGGAFTSFSVYPLRVYTHLGAIGTLTIICEIIFVIYLIVLLVKICVRIYQQRCGYFNLFWQNFEITMFITGIAVIVIYVFRLLMTHSTIDKFKADKRLFVDFSHIVLWDQILVSLLSILVFMATLRLLEVFATSKKVSAVVYVFKDCGKDLFWYGMTFLYIFMAFCFLGMLLFGSQLESYKSMYQCMGTLFIAMIGKSKFTEINETQPILAKVFFIFYILTIVFFILTIFLAILGASIDTVVQGDRVDKNEDIIEIMMKRFKLLIAKPSSKQKTHTKVKKHNKVVSS